MFSTKNSHTETIAKHFRSVYNIDAIFQSAIFSQVVLLNRPRLFFNTIFIICYAEPIQNLCKISIIYRTNTMIKSMNLVIGDEHAFREEQVGFYCGTATNVPWNAYFKTSPTI